MKIIQKNFNKYLKKNFLFENNPKIAVAVSGGPDSMALTFLLQNWVKKNNGSLVALIVNHKLRSESGIEADIVKTFLQKKKIQTKILTVVNKKILKKNMQEARNNRFHELTKFCKEKYILHLFLAHHFDDQIETFLLRKISGSNFEGLRSLQIKVFNPYVQILRPLLNYNKRDILNYNKKKNIFYVKDPSNLNKKYSRTAIRDFLILHKNYRKDIEKDLNKITKYYPVYKKMIYQILNSILIKVNSKKLYIDFDIFSNLQQEIQIKIIEIIYKFLKPQKLFLRYDKTLKILNLLTNQEKIIANLGGMNIKKTLNFIHFNA